VNVNRRLSRRIDQSLIQPVAMPGRCTLDCRILNLAEFTAPARVYPKRWARREPPFTRRGAWALLTGQLMSAVCCIRGQNDRARLSRYTKIPSFKDVCRMVRGRPRRSTKRSCAPLADPLPAHGVEQPSAAIGKCCLPRSCREAGQSLSSKRRPRVVHDQKRERRLSQTVSPTKDSFVVALQGPQSQRACTRNCTSPTPAAGNLNGRV